MHPQKPIAASPETVTYWENQASKLEWSTRWNTAIAGEAPFLRWFADGTLNASVNCLDRHCAAGMGERTALIWESEAGETVTYTYAQLLTEVEAAARGLRALNVGTGDRVAIFMGMLPEAVISMLACARIGAIHSIIFAGFGTDAVADRLNDLGATTVITATGSHRRSKTVPLFNVLQSALAKAPSVTQTIVVPLDHQLPEAGNFISWADFIAQGATQSAAPETMSADAPLFVLYTSGTTGKPKGIYHSTGGYLTAASASFRTVFNPTPEDIYWCTADLGWISGHTYVVYGPLSNGCTVFMYEGALDFPSLERSWEMCERHDITIYYTAPTLIRQFIREATVPCETHNLERLRLLGSVGEPINPEVWKWYAANVGGERCPVVDTWWQTETGAIAIAPSAGIELRPGSATKPLPGMHAAVVNEEGHEVAPDEQGFLVLTEAWPSMPLGIWGDPERYVSSYFERFPGAYWSGDLCRRDNDGYFWLQGRADDILLVAGHNISTAEVESALVEHIAVAEAAVVGKDDPITGQAVWAFVILKDGNAPTADLLSDIAKFVGQSKGPILRPARLLPVRELPKTQSGKILRRLLRDIANSRETGAAPTITNPDSLKLAKRAVQETNLN